MFTEKDVWAFLEMVVPVKIYVLAGIAACFTVLGGYLRGKIH